MTDFLEEAVAREANWNQLLSYWCDLAANFAFSPQEFYALVTKHLAAQHVPGLETRHVLMRASSRFSAERLYLQFRRERLVFEICGFPFGTGFFASSRLFDRRKKPTWLDYVILLGVLGLWGLPITYQWGWRWSVIATTGVVALVWSLMRLAQLETMAWLDRVLSGIPILGLLHDKLFHPDTFYRQDTNNAYRGAVNLAVREAVNEMRSSKGLTPLTDEQWRPVMRGLER
ncbi:MAG: hypothetical protein ACYC6M_12875 [Terriglobales bacterium]